MYIYSRGWRMVHELTGSDNRRPMAIVKRHENVKPGKKDKR